MVLTPRQIQSLVVIERTTASISVVSTLILITTFCFFKKFRTLSNTLIFYASFANLCANVAALMGRDAVAFPNGAACQFQAFLLEMFMQSDPLWSCAMAINVYLCIFRRWDTGKLRKMHWIYAVLCYGLPFIPAMFCLFYREAGRGKMYGNATLWCWIKNEYSDVRIWSYYLPIWISIVISLSIYFRVGIVIYKVRATIRAIENESGDYTCPNTAANSTANSPNNTRVNSFALGSPKKLSTTSSEDEKSPEPVIPHPADEIEDTRPRDEEDDDDYQISRWDSVDTSMLSYPSLAHIKCCPTSVDPETGLIARTQTRTTFRADTTFPISPLDPTYTHPSRLARPSISSFSPSLSQINELSQTTTRPSHKMDKIRWAYTKSALLFTISILITWIPASINRVQGLVDKHNPNYYMNAISAAVLPLQGFWNTVIFFVSSWGVVKRSWRRWRRRVRQDRRDRQARKALGRFENGSNAAA